MKKLAAVLLAIVAGLTTAHSATAPPARATAAPTVSEALREAGIATPRQSTLLAQANMSCGLPPLPPIGCKVGACTCDRNGRNCEWTFICG